MSCRRTLFKLCKCRPRTLAKEGSKQAGDALGLASLFAGTRGMDPSSSPHITPKKWRNFHFLGILSPRTTSKSFAPEVRDHSCWRGAYRDLSWVCGFALYNTCLGCLQRT